MNIYTSGMLLILFATNAMVASEPKTVDCDSLAQYIRNQMRHVYPYACKDENGVLQFVRLQQTEGKSCEVISPCLFDPIPSPDSPKANTTGSLQHSLRIFKTYQAALVHCVKTSEKHCPLAEETITAVTQKKELLSQCYDKFGNSVHEQWELEMYVESHKKSALTP